MCQGSTAAAAGHFADSTIRLLTISYLHGKAHEFLAAFQL